MQPFTVKRISVEFPDQHARSHHCRGAAQVIGREAEVARVVQVLARRSKNNPVLLGDPGVGKTAIAEGVARAIVTGQRPTGR